MDPVVTRLVGNLERLRERIATAAARVERSPDEITVVAISKYATSVETAALATAMHEIGMPVILGESRVQNLIPKAAELTELPFSVQWDLVGSLQRNKAARAVQTFTRIHSLDREGILQHLHEIALREDRRIEGFLQVNISGEGAKHGFEPEGLGAALELALSLPRMEIRGLMGMAPRGTDHETARPAFARLRALRDRFAPELPELSMGMSGDFVGAILEGATILRIGSALFSD